jgi:hypothetical protein
VTVERWEVRTEKKKNLWDLLWDSPTRQRWQQQQQWGQKKQQSAKSCSGSGNNVGVGRGVLRHDKTKVVVAKVLVLAMANR